MADHSLLAKRRLRNIWLCGTTSDGRIKASKLQVRGTLVLAVVFVLGANLPDTSGGPQLMLHHRVKYGDPAAEKRARRDRIQGLWQRSRPNPLAAYLGSKSAMTFHNRPFPGRAKIVIARKTVLAR